MSAELSSLIGAKGKGNQQGSNNVGTWIYYLHSMSFIIKMICGKHILFVYKLFGYKLDVSHFLKDYKTLNQKLLRR